jgi:hypothetical protein
LISREVKRGEEVDGLLRVLFSLILFYLARLRLPRFQRLIPFFEIPGPRIACRRSSTQAPIFYAFGAQDSLGG